MRRHMYERVLFSVAVQQKLSKIAFLILDVIVIHPLLCRVDFKDGRESGCGK